MHQHCSIRVTCDKGFLFIAAVWRRASQWQAWLTLWYSLQVSLYMSRRCRFILWHHPLPHTSSCLLCHPVAACEDMIHLHQPSLLKWTGSSLARPSYVAPQVCPHTLALETQALDLFCQYLEEHKWRLAPPVQDFVAWLDIKSCGGSVRLNSPFFQNCHYHRTHQH